MDVIDKTILNSIQQHFPISSRPYLEIANQLGISEEEVIFRIKSLKEAGLIRRIGGIFDSKKLGYISTLCAMKVPEDEIETVAELINSYPEVTHNYQRNHEYNLWFTFIAPSEKLLKIKLEEIKQTTKINDLINLPATNLFKIKVNFQLKEEA